jgi:hypothetical protein
MLCLAVLAAAPASAAVPVPPTPSGLPSGIETLSAYVGANSCDAAAKPGASALGTLLTQTYPGTSYHVARPCGSDSLSTTEHYDGRAVDWMVNVRNTTQRDYANAAISWMLATDTRGNQFAQARRLGVMYVIWNNRSWSSYRSSEGWREYNGCLASSKAGTAYDTACHRNHVHVSLSWSGAMKRSSYWSKSVAAQEFGPCRSWYLNWATPSTTVNPARCLVPAAVQPLPSATALGRQLIGFSGMYLKEGRTGPAVTAVQAAIGTPATGTFSATTRSALLGWQQRQGIAATGVTDAPTWWHLIRTQARPAVAVGLDADFRSDLLARRPDGTLTLHRSVNDVTGRAVAAGWHVMDTVVAPGDFSGDQQGDVLTRRSDGSIWLYAGNGQGGLAAGKRLSTAWGVFDQILSPGDFTGDGRSDLLARHTDGSLWLYAGTGRGSWGAGRQVASGWQAYERLTAGGDSNGDGASDVLALRADGALVLFAGNGTGGWSGSGRVVSAGWGGLDLLVGVR